jgi:putative ABC transport system permease protein
MKLLRRLILRPLRRDPLRTALTILSVALGIAVIVAVDLAGNAATGSFHASMETLAGHTDLEILANGGIDERYFGVLAQLPVNARFAPIVLGLASIPDIGPVPLYGVDLLGKDGLLVSHALSARVRPGVTLLIGGRPFTFDSVRTAETGPGEFVALDIAAAQQALGRYGKLDRIDVTAEPGEELERVEREVRAALPPSYLIGRPGTRSEENQRMLRAFRWNLRVLSYISLVVGAFLIYNTISVSVVRRRAEIGILRAVGAERSTVVALFLAEAVLFGAGGAAVGIGLGRLLAIATVQSIAGTVNALYTTSRPAAVALTWSEAAMALAIGIAVSLFSALAPAREAMRVAPAEAMGRGAHEHRAVLRWRRRLAASAVLAALAVACSQAAPIGGSPIGGYAAAFLSIAAASMAAPAIVLAVHRILRTSLRRRAEGLLAGRSLTASLSRTSVVVAALATAIAMMASVGIMVGSFRETVALWLDTQLRADLYVRPDVPSGAGEHPPLDPDVPAKIAAIRGVAAVDDFRAIDLHYAGERATLGAGNLDVVRRFGRLRFLHGEDRDAILRSLPGRDRAIVSEPFANRLHIRPGDRLTLPIGEQLVTLDVAGVYYDYSSSQGFVIVDRSTMLHYVPNQPPSNVAVYLAPGADAAAVQHEIQLRTAGSGVAVAPNSELRRNAIVIFDRTFAITWALEAVAIVVAMLGAANSLLALVLDRRRELGLLRYLGASNAQIRGMILTEAGLLGALAILLGLALGFALSLLLIFVVNKQSFGWTIQFYVPSGLLAGALLLVWAVTVLAAIYPSRVATRLDPLDAIREE